VAHPEVKGFWRQLFLARRRGTTAIRYAVCFFHRQLDRVSRRNRLPEVSQQLSRYASIAKPFAFGLRPCDYAGDLDGQHAGFVGQNGLAVPNGTAQSLDYWMFSLAPFFLACLLSILRADTNSLREIVRLMTIFECYHKPLTWTFDLIVQALIFSPRETWKAVEGEHWRIIGRFNETVANGVNCSICGSTCVQ